MRQEELEYLAKAALAVTANGPFYEEAFGEAGVDWIQNRLSVLSAIYDDAEEAKCVIEAAIRCAKGDEPEWVEEDQKQKPYTANEIRSAIAYYSAVDPSMLAKYTPTYLVEKRRMILKVVARGKELLDRDREEDRVVILSSTLQ